MNIEASKQYMETLRKRYLKGTKKEKGEILNEYCRNTGQERKYVSKKFNYKIKLKRKEDRKKRVCFYDGAVIAVLVIIESDQISEKEKEALTAIYHSLNPAELKRAVDKKLDNLYKIYQKKKGQENTNSTNKLNPSLASFFKMAQEEVLVS